jgi:hypothetical protein
LNHPSGIILNSGKRWEISSMKTKLSSSRWVFLSLILSLASILSTLRLAEAQPSAADAIRFLEQSTFGPTPELIARVQQTGFEAFLDEQLAAPISDYLELPFWPQTRPTSCTGDCQRDNYTYYQLQRHFFTNALYGQDQLRQRVAFALGQILVTSQVDVPLPSWMRGYQQLLYRSAFGNFRQLLYDVTLNPTMGRFLDMLNNRCQTRTPPDVNICRNGLNSQPNENYAREILQLFSIGTFLLTQDGTRQLDGNGNPIPSYDQKTVEEFARVFTGWILAATLPGPEGIGGTVPNYRDPMRVRVSGGVEDYHDKGPKALLNGLQLPGGQAQAVELGAAIDNIVRVLRRRQWRRACLAGRHPHHESHHRRGLSPSRTRKRSRGWTSGVAGNLSDRPTGGVFSRGVGGLHRQGQR